MNEFLESQTELGSAVQRDIRGKAKQPDSQSGLWWIHSDQQPTLRFHSQLPKQERIHVRELLDLLGYWLACAVAGLGFYP